MTNLVPGFIWHPIDVAGRAKRVKGRGAVGHVAVSGSTNLVPSGTAAARSADWHWYNPKVGPGIQYIDLDLQCWASGAGNRTLAAFESQGGLGTAAQVNAEPWNDNQIENAARFYAHLVVTEGAPLQVMPNSLPGSRGLAGHRHGIDPWRVSGGEVWSSSRGKLCPGDAKMAQLPVIVSRAAEIVHGSPTPIKKVQEDHMLVNAPNRGTALVGPGYYNSLTPEEANSWAAAGQPTNIVTTAQFDAIHSAAVGAASLPDIYKWLRGGDPDHDNIFLIWAMLTKVVAQLENPAELAQALAATLPGVSGAASQSEIESALRNVLGSLKAS